MSTAPPKPWVAVLPEAQVRLPVAKRLLSQASPLSPAITPSAPAKRQAIKKPPLALVFAIAILATAIMIVVVGLLLLAPWDTPPTPQQHIEALGRQVVPLDDLANDEAEMKKLNEEIVRNMRAMDASVGRR